MEHGNTGRKEELAFSFESALQHHNDMGVLIRIGVLRMLWTTPTASVFVTSVAASTVHVVWYSYLQFLLQS